MDEVERMQELVRRYGTIDAAKRELDELHTRYVRGEISWDQLYCDGNEIAQDISFWEWANQYV